MNASFLHPVAHPRYCCSRYPYCCCCCYLCFDRTNMLHLLLLLLLLLPLPLPLLLLLLLLAVPGLRPHLDLVVHVADPADVRPAKVPVDVIVGLHPAGPGLEDLVHRVTGGTSSRRSRRHRKRRHRHKAKGYKGQRKHEALCNNRAREGFSAVI